VAVSWGTALVASLARSLYRSLARRGLLASRGLGHGCFSQYQSSEYGGNKIISVKTSLAKSKTPLLKEPLMRCFTFLFIIIC